MTCLDVHVGDKVRIHNESDNAAFKAGFYTMTVVEEDGISFAVDCIGPWWFFRHDGKSYVGNATVIGVNQRDKDITVSWKDKDVTDLVDFQLNDDEWLPLTKCVCGARFRVWDFIINSDDERPRECPKCGSGLYFTVAIRVFEKEVT